MNQLLNHVATVGFNYNFTQPRYIRILYFIKIHTLSDGGPSLAFRISKGNHVGNIECPRQTAEQIPNAAKYANRSTYAASLAVAAK